MYKRQLTNQLNLRADFSTGAVEHFLSAGMELTREEQTAWGVASTGSRPPANLYDPDWNDAGDFAWSRSGAVARGRTDTRALYVFDTLKFGEHLLVTAGARADRYTTDYAATSVCNTPGTSGDSGRNVVYCGTAPVGALLETANLSDSDTLLNYKLGVVYKPVAAVSLYANAALSQQPPGGGSFALNTNANSADNLNNEPQKAKTRDCLLYTSPSPRD